MEWIKTKDKLPQLTSLGKYSDAVVGWNKDNFWEKIFLAKIKNKLRWVTVYPLDLDFSHKSYDLNYYTHWTPITQPKEEE